MRTLPPWRHRFHELAFRTLFRIAAWFGDSGQRAVYRAYFGWLYRRRDPWGYEQSAYERAKYERTLELLAGVHANRVLEAGCSEGVFTEMLLSRGVASAVVGVDVNSVALARARERCARYPGASFVQTNLSVDAPAGPFDLILCAEVLYYLGGRASDAAALLCERLAPGGLLMTVNPSDRAAQMDGTFARRLQLERRVDVEDPWRPYVIEIYRAP